MRKNQLGIRFTLLLNFLFFCNVIFSQNVIDSCFTSATPVFGSGFISTPTLANVHSSDVVNWTGTTWFGGYPGVNLTIPPPANQIGCRAIFLGSGSQWTTGGEQVGLKLDAPLVSGTSYSFSITYVSQGLYSDGSFSPSFYTSATPSMTGAVLAGSLTAVGYTWTTNTFSFVATPQQNGHSWIILKTEQNDSSGLINSFCVNCNQPTTTTCSVAVNSQTICQGDSATITATPTPAGNYTYVWTVPTGFTNPGNISSFSSNVAGNYTVTITNTTTNCSSLNASGTLTVNQRPTVSVNSQTICQGDLATITAAPSGNYSYAWTVPTGFSNPGNVSSFSSNVAGNYTVTITNTITNCNSVIATGIVSVNPKPVVIVNSEAICWGDSATITATPNTSGNYSYQWTVPDGFSNPGNVNSFTSTIGGNYVVTITDTASNCNSLPETGILEVFPDFEFTIERYCHENDFILEILPIDNSFSIDNSSFVWQVNSVTIPENSTILNLTSYLNSTPAIEGLPITINVAVTSNDGCTKPGILIVDNIYCGIQKGISTNNDGNNDFLDLTLLGVGHLSVFNRYGSKVFEKKDYLNQWKGQSDDGDTLPDGVYYYVIEFKDNSAAKTGWIYLLRENN